MRKVALLAVLAAIGVLSVGAVAIAGDGDGSSKNGARLNGYQEVSAGGGSISTGAFGSFHLRISRNEQRVDYTLSYRGLESAVTQAHIHFAQRAVGGPIALWLCDPDPAAGPNVPAGAPAVPVCPPASGGSVSDSFGPADLLATGRGLGPGTGAGNEREWDELIAAIKVGATYANVHTVTFGGGEIRGQINDRDQKEYTGPPPFIFGGGDNDDD
jgi:CHRD domain